MQLYLNKKTMRIQVICGILEKYEPTKNVKIINSKVTELHKKLIDFQQKTVHLAIKEIEELIKEENSKYIEVKKEENNSEEE